MNGPLRKWLFLYTWKKRFNCGLEMGVDICWNTLVQSRERGKPLFLWLSSLPPGTHNHCRHPNGTFQCQPIHGLPWTDFHYSALNKPILWLSSSPIPSGCRPNPSSLIATYYNGLPKLTCILKVSTSSPHTQFPKEKTMAIFEDHLTSAKSSLTLTFVLIPSPTWKDLSWNQTY